MKATVPRPRATFFRGDRCSQIAYKDRSGTSPTLPPSTAGDRLSADSRAAHIANRRRASAVLCDRQCGRRPDSAERTRTDRRIFRLFNDSVRIAENMNASSTTVPRNRGTAGQRRRLRKSGGALLFNDCRRKAYSSSTTPSAPAASSPCAPPKTSAVLGRVSTKLRDTSRKTR